MTSKTICTATVFVAIVSVTAAGFWIKVPPYVWWGCGVNSPNRTMPLVVWMAVNILYPAGIAGAIGVICVAIWDASEAICGKLREWAGRGI